MKTLSVIRLSIAACVLALLPVPGHALTPSQVFDKVKDSVVVVKTLDAQGKVKLQGSGVLVSPGRVATSCHVVEGGISYLVGRGKQVVSSTLYAEDRDKDICLLDAKGIQGKPAQLGKAARLKKGEPVYAVGAPRGLELSLSHGIVARLQGGPPPMIQTTAAISPGSSGGGLFDGEGRLVGLTAFSLEGAQKGNFAMPVEWIGEVKPGRTTAAQGPGLNELFKRAIALEAAKDWQGLLEWCLKWTKSEPQNVDAWCGLGNAYSSLERYDDAIEAYRQAIRIHPEDAGAWYNLGNAYRGPDRENDAIEAFRQAIRINPEYGDAWFNLGNAYGRLKRYDDAVEAFRQAVRIDRKAGDAWFNLGNAYRGLDRYDEAIEAYRQAVTIDPERAEPWNELGTAYRHLDRDNDAIEAFRQAVRIDPEYAHAWYNLGNAYRRLRRYNDAIEAFRQAIRSNPERAEPWTDLGTVYGHLGRHNDAIEAYRQAIKIDPEYADAWFCLAAAYVVSGNTAAALDAVRELRRLDPTGADDLLNAIAALTHGKSP